MQGMHKKGADTGDSGSLYRPQDGISKQGAPESVSLVLGIYRKTPQQHDGKGNRHIAAYNARGKGLADVAHGERIIAYHIVFHSDHIGAAGTMSFIFAGAFLQPCVKHGFSTAE